MSTWFTELEDVVYSIVEYIPVVGTVYSFDRAGIAYNELDWARHWQSVGNFLESSIRDVLLFKGIGEPIPVMLLHTMAESFTDKMIEIYHREPKKPKIEIKTELNKHIGHVLVAESKMGLFRSQVFEGKAKGVHHFHGAVFTGTLIDSRYAPAPGEKIRLDIPRGLYDGAKVTFSWNWTHDYYGKNRPESTMGHIQLKAGTPTEFKLSSRKGAGGWDGYDFWGKINSKDKITATTRINGIVTQIVFKRVSGT